MTHPAHPDPSGAEHLDAQQAARVRVRGPATAPEEEEVLLAPRRGHVRRRATPGQVRELIRHQLRLGVLLGLGFFLLVVVLYLLLSTVAGLADVTVLGVPLPWVVPAVCFYPLLILGGWLHVRASDAAERRLLTTIGAAEAQGVERRP
ncbi:hypothetical protein Q7C18_01070 [Nesterenkonia sp. CL21]|uniref:hypothetical protein n=1 Tax=Nesterenkonia sp. CL21 TaxID=3064894 RepID=UPI002878AFF9|nr:hypothetical protein [Nesterenkonia sp. CL21]MDS2171286.1 hypothetical protein [Nesterenkonia sp. CL21]